MIPVLTFLLALLICSLCLLLVANKWEYISRYQQLLNMAKMGDVPPERLLAGLRQRAERAEERAVQAEQEVARLRRALSSQERRPR